MGATTEAGRTAEKAETAGRVAAGAWKPAAQATRAVNTSERSMVEV